MNQDQMRLALEEFVLDEGFDAACLALSDVCQRLGGHHEQWVPELGNRATAKKNLWQRRAQLLFKLATAE